MLKGPTLTSVKDRKMLTGTGIYKAKCAPNLEKTFKQLVAEGEVVSGEDFEMTDPSSNGMKLVRITVEIEADEEMK